MDPAPKEFKDVTIYTPGNIIWPNVVRIDATKAKIWVGPYAQHKESVYVEFTRKGKRKTETLVSSDKPYVVVVPTTHAIQPDDLYLPPVEGVSSTRYGVADPRWRTDFDEQLRSANVPILADYRNLSSEAETGEAVLGPQISGDQLPAMPSEPATDSKYEPVDAVRRRQRPGVEHHARREQRQKKGEAMKEEQPQQLRARIGYRTDVIQFRTEVLRHFPTAQVLDVPSTAN